MTGYYDYVLGLIPTALIGVTACLTLVGLSSTAAISGGALVAGAAVAHAMFVRSPVTGVSGSDRDAVGDALDQAAGQSQSGRRGTGGAD